MKLCISVPTAWLAIVFAAALGLSGCSGTDNERDRTTTGETTSAGSTSSGSSSAGATDSGATDSGELNGSFALEPIAPLALEEGSPDGVNIPIRLSRQNGHNKNVAIDIEGATDEDQRLVTFNTDSAQINGAANTGSINLKLGIGDLPISTQQRTFFISASDGTETARVPVEINVTPVNAPEVYLLIGQSNMVGFSGDGTKLAGAGGPDEPNPRILQLNASKNDQWEVFTSKAAFKSLASNIIESNRIVQAEDPLHIPLDPSNTSGKDVSYIGMGLSFAKAALQDTENNIVLVPAAWSGSAFCDNEDGPNGQWNAKATANPNLGNTWLFDRAVTRTNIALAETKGILRGILWHQGESDANDRCAGEYLANLESLAKALRTQIDADRRGEALRQEDANIPFVLGTMSRGIDDRGDLSDYWLEKQMIDDAHRMLPSKINHAALTVSDDITPANGYPCGNDSCIHYGPSALREIGRRYYDALQRAVANP